ncbi:L-serine ammonia-lyase [Paraburkholderia caballeronis]|uniref:L-serine dehydratase n=1 Tax=Paraburkholderia caballeronis TaxID=416943 RepID=A0A1H7GWW9_9BURK|nr:L-serine ammonia-lyase [Paraburkholderia caballeronis]PXW29733.1 L-serine ammonia-lyase [Paraburkholderia caballeronis]PXX04992.1 L-serine ammonia-lyase [Paraburkholderia caballeronis]RAK06053.1 L-serine ammonia-lyase [Paraburkholderia caballeronis]SEB47542.1 L-serine ammonia-lyase [Paraburkholderia caballeronis]SEK42646.1 L-serine ammonia-lyase [Paraburkholderia caballeronis]
MAVSVFDLFKIGIGPSSSHTVGPMRAALMFAEGLERDGLLASTTAVKVELYGSLGATGKGHGTDRGVMLGLLGDAPDTVNPDTIAERLDAIRTTRTLALLGRHPVPFVPKEHIAFYRQALPEHPNGMKLRALDSNSATLRESTYLSVGGGFVVTAGAPNTKVLAAVEQLPHPFSTGAELLATCAATGKSIAQLMLDNERVWRDDDAIRSGLLRIWDVMQSCVARGCGIGNPSADGTLPGPFNVKRRAPQLYRALTGNPERALQDPLSMIDWINLYAIAVNEENAAGGRVVTAPTNGAAGIVPAVLHYYTRFTPGANEQGVIDFLLTAAAIGILYKLNASISGAEVGCQGEVGVACSMAAGALAAVMGGTPQQVENAAEIGMEHNLGLTCDPVGGMVQIPCIERNAMASVKAVNAARMALRGDGAHYVSLDSVIKTMRETGADMKTKYKETSRGGLAVNIVEC